MVKLNMLVLLNVLHCSFLFLFLGLKSAKAGGTRKKKKKEMHHELSGFSKRESKCPHNNMHWSCYVSSSYFWPSIGNCTTKGVKPFTNQAT